MNKEDGSLPPGGLHSPGGGRCPLLSSWLFPVVRVIDSSHAGTRLPLTLRAASWDPQWEGQHQNVGSLSHSAMVTSRSAGSLIRLSVCSFTRPTSMKCLLGKMLQCWGSCGEQNRHSARHRGARVVGNSVNKSSEMPFYCLILFYR